MEIFPTIKKVDVKEGETVKVIVGADPDGQELIGKITKIKGDNFWLQADFLSEESIEELENDPEIAEEAEALLEKQIAHKNQEPFKLSFKLDQVIKLN